MLYCGKCYMLDCIVYDCGVVYYIQLYRLSVVLYRIVLWYCIKQIMYIHIYIYY